MRLQVRLGAATLAAALALGGAVVRADDTPKAEQAAEVQQQNSATFIVEGMT